MINRLLILYEMVLRMSFKAEGEPLFFIGNARYANGTGILIDSDYNLIDIGSEYKYCRCEGGYWFKSEWSTTNMFEESSSDTLCSSPSSSERNLLSSNGL